MILDKITANKFLTEYKSLLCMVENKKLNDLTDYVKARDKLFNNINKFLVHTTSDELREAISNGIFGRFIIYKCDKRKTIFCDVNDNFHDVKGVSQEISDYCAPWMVIETVVMNYCGNTICDGLVNDLRISVGRNIESRLKEKYRSLTSRLNGERRRGQPRFEN